MNTINYLWSFIYFIVFSLNNLILINFSVQDEASKIFPSEQSIEKSDDVDDLPSEEGTKPEFMEITITKKREFYKNIYLFIYFIVYNISNGGLRTQVS